MHIALLPLRKYSDFGGRASRREFWSFFALSAAIFVAVVVLTGVSAESSAEANPTWALVYVFWWVVSAVPWWALQVRRLHDQGRAGALVWLNIAAYAALFAMPAIGLALLALSYGLMALPGEAASNRYGEPADDAPGDGNPKGAHAKEAFPTASDPHAPDSNGVTRLSSGRFDADGHSFATYREAHQFVAGGRRRAQSAPIRPSVVRAPALRATQAIPGSAPKVAQSPAAVPPTPGLYDVARTPDGRFTCGGYTFTTQAQAESFAARRRGGGRAMAPREVMRPAERHRGITPGEGRGSAPAARAAPPGSARHVPPHANNKAGSGILLGRLPVSSPAQWIARPERVDVAGIAFEAELLYFGKGGGPGNPVHRALVDPTLPVAAHSDAHGGTLDYWPHYGELAPSARRAYLEWLAGGRNRPDVSIGYVFVYFYGLERRLIAEKSEQDAPAILAEARRLLGIYGENYSFRNYCGALIEAGELIFDLAPADEPVSLDLRRSWEIPISVRLRLGRKVRDGLPIDADDALRWTLTHPQLYPRTAVTRCFEEFCALWRVRFGEAFPGGIKVRPGKARLQFHYRAASSEFNAHASVEDLPDIGAIAGPVSKLDALLTSCTEELDPLSRFLGRNADERSSLLAAALCPAPALTPAAAAAVADARAALFARQTTDGLAQAPLAEVLGILAGTAAAEAEQRAVAAKRLPAILDALGIGFEPDKRHGAAPTLSHNTVLCLFDLDGSAPPVQDREEYRAARTMIEIAVLAAKADEVVVEAEMEAILADLARFTGLDARDRRRLHAHACALVANPSKLRAATKRLLELPEAEKDAVLAAAVHAVLADGRVLPTEVRFLEGLYKSLGKPQDDVYARLHAAGSGSQPRAGTAPARAGAIDADRLARLREETTAVSSLLSAIFREDEAPAAPVQPAGERAAPRLPGLDPAHTHLLLALAAQPIEIDAFEELCRTQRLLPDGAIETINDWSFDELDDLAIECEDIVSIQPHLIPRIRSMAAA